MADEKENAKPDASGKDQVALELMKFITVTTGYGKGSPNTGFTSSAKTRTPEEHADALIQLFERCRQVVNKPAE